MTSPQREPALSLTLNQDFAPRPTEISLKQDHYFGHNRLKIKPFDTERAVTLVCLSLNVNDAPSNKNLDLLGALRSGLIELTELGKDDIIAVPAGDPSPLGRTSIPPTLSPEGDQSQGSLYMDTTSTVWKSIFQHEKTYELRLSKNGGETWAYYTDD
ncbi:hypothetical protein CC86DRAFT_467284 [Ophiobolus disseminans]|uniref:Uncharacterized protein n=1 Tax=Ophiobolus disseminans TaxID=1469910 RepID=A0A6A6ZXN1_9PLEO|nr:hypothetical protein CC86DRAFT_467284 [Ophiobolus disseminans]